jgi:LuxR family maltose regulon positive regulatory protein
MTARRPRPPFRPGLVAREPLIASLMAATQAPLALVVAPAGYGKTTALLEWAELDHRPFAWVGLEPGDDDVVRLLTAIALELDELEPVGRDIFRALRSDTAAVRESVLPRLGASLAGRRRAFVLVLDDAHVLRSPAALGALDVILEHLPRGSQLALASRVEPALRIGRLRAHRRVVELRAQDLAMTCAEAGILLSGLGLRPADVEVLHRRTEGWPAGLSLAALSLQEQPDRSRGLARFAGDDRLVADYLRDELLSDLPADRITFLTRTSVLDDLSGPLCDAVLAEAGAGRTLRVLARSNASLL